METSSIILKILSGLQAGVEVALPDGDYRIGSGPDDDIRIIDVTLKAGHVRLRINGRKIEISGGSGAVAAKSGITLQPNGDFQEIEPLDVLSAGTTRFALGLSSANWATIAEAEDQETSGDRKEKAARKADAVTNRKEGARSSWLVSRAFAALSAAAVVGVAGLFLTQSGAGFEKISTATPESELSLVRAAVDSFPFGKKIEVRQEVDGALFVDGYVETLAERRAINAAVEKTGVPAKTRLRVLESIRNEVASLIESRKLPVQSSVSDTGVLSLTGVMLDSKAVDEFISLIGQDVIGITKVDSRIETAETLFKDVEQLAKVSKVEPYLIFRLDNQLIEVSGAVPVDKIDPWVGFLQAFAERYAPKIPLRSYVQLQDANGATVPAPAGAPGITLGAVASDNASKPLDVERLRDGSFDLKDVFVGDGAGVGPLVNSGTPTANGTAGSTTAVGPRVNTAAATPAGTGQAAAGSGATTATPGDQVADAGPAGEQPASTVNLLQQLLSPSPANAATPQAEATTAPGTATAPTTSVTPESASVEAVAPEGNAIAGAPPETAVVKDNEALPAAGPEIAAGTRDVATPVAPTAETPSVTAGQPAGDAVTDLAADPAKPAAVTAGSTDAAVADVADADAPKPVPETAQAAGETPITPPATSTATAATDAAAENDQGAITVTAKAEVGQGPAAPQGELAVMADRLINLWNEKKAGKTGVTPANVDLPGESGLAEAVQNYSSLFVLTRDQSGAQTEQCWPGSALTRDKLAHVMFWLDLLSVDSRITVASFKDETRLMLLEAAVNPEKTRNCIEASFPGKAIRSVYLAEIERNPDFIQFIIRDLPPFDLKVMGAKVAPSDRYILTEDGRKLVEGGAPNGASRVVVVGELGVIIQMKTELATRLYDDSISWVIQ